MSVLLILTDFVRILQAHHWSIHHLWFLRVSYVKTPYSWISAKALASENIFIPNILKVVFWIDRWLSALNIIIHIKRSRVYNYLRSPSRVLEGIAKEYIGWTLFSRSYNLTETRKLWSKLTWARKWCCFPLTESIHYLTTTMRNSSVWVSKSLGCEVAGDLDKLLNSLSSIIFQSLKWKF